MSVKICSEWISFDFNRIAPQSRTLTFTSKYKILPGLICMQIFCMLTFYENKTIKFDPFPSRYASKRKPLVY